MPMCLNAPCCRSETIRDAISGNKEKKDVVANCVVEILKKLCRRKKQQPTTDWCMCAVQNEYWNDRLNFNQNCQTIHMHCTQLVWCWWRNEFVSFFVFFFLLVSFSAVPYFELKTFRSAQCVRIVCLCVYGIRKKRVCRDLNVDSARVCNRFWQIYIPTLWRMYDISHNENYLKRKQYIHSILRSLFIVLFTFLLRMIVNSSNNLHSCLILDAIVIVLHA